MKRLVGLLEWLIGVTTGLLFLLVLWQVIARVVLRFPTTWTVELGRVFFTVIVFVGAAVLVYENRHMQILTLHERLPKLPARLVGALNNCLAILFLVFFLRGSFARLVSNWRVRIPTLEWMTLGYLYSIVTAGGVLMLLFTVRNLLALLRSRD